MIIKTTMSWTEFKAYVDKELDEQGVPGSEPVDYIDITGPDTTHSMMKPTVAWDHEGIAIF